MSKIQIILAGIYAASFLGLTTPASGGVGASGCDDLSSIAQTPMVDFQSQIQPIFDSCANCHGESGPAGLDLRAGQSYDNLVGVISTTNSSRLRVDPFNPGTSAVFLAVNCDSPGGPGFRMPGATLQQQALIRDWIAQGALAEPTGLAEPVSVPVDDVRALGALIILLVLLTGFSLRRNALSRPRF